VRRVPRFVVRLHDAGTGERQWVLVTLVDDAAGRGSDVVSEQPRSGRTWQELATG
jgi:hypothetical protein